MAVSIKVIAVLFFGAVFINAVVSDPLPQEAVGTETVVVDPVTGQRTHKTKGQYVTRIHKVKIPITPTAPVSPPVAVLPSRPTLGCFRDSSKRLLPKLNELSDNSPGRCIDVCLNSGFQFAGVQYGKECWCGNDKPASQFVINDDQCNKECSGNPSEKCGGDWAMNVFYTGLPSVVPNPTLGCLRDSAQRLLPKLNELSDNSPARCIEVCTQSGYQFAGVEYGKECWCGNDKPGPQFVINKDQCNMQCSGSPFEKCGGNWAINVYYTGLQNTLGCVKDSKTRLLPKKVDVKDNSPKHCIEACSKAGYEFAGVQYAKECWCGNDKPGPQFIIGDDKCNMKCPKEPSEKCGGSWAMNVFYTGLPSGSAPVVEPPQKKRGCKGGLVGDTAKGARNIADGGLKGVSNVVGAITGDGKTLGAVGGIVNGVGQGAVNIAGREVDEAQHTIQDAACGVANIANEALHLNVGGTIKSAVGTAGNIIGHAGNMIGKIFKG